MKTITIKGVLYEIVDVLENKHFKNKVLCVSRPKGKKIFMATVFPSGAIGSLS